MIGETLLKYFLKIIFLKGLKEARKGLCEKGKEMATANWLHEELQDYVKPQKTRVGNHIGSGGAEQKINQNLDNCDERESQMCMRVQRAFGR